MKRSRVAIGTAVLTSAVTSLAMLGAAPAVGEAHVSPPIVKKLQGALQIDVTSGHILVAQNAMGGPPVGELTWVGEDGTTESLVQLEGMEIAGMARADDRIAFVATRFDHDNPEAVLMVRDEEGNVEEVADLHRFEKRHNPDGDVRYGVRVRENCAAKLPKMVRPYQGIIEAHPYAIANAPGGGWYVADAAGNSILKVSPEGVIELVEVLRPARVEITKKVAEAFGLDDCAVGKTVAFEPVPTDVEVTDRGRLIVSSLAGGPEHPALGHKGSVRWVNPNTGRQRVIAPGLVSAVNLAISDAGVVYVADLFGGQIRKLVGEGRTRLVTQVPSPAAIEWFEGQIYASVGLFSRKGGKLVTITEDDASS